MNSPNALFSSVFGDYQLHRFPRPQVRQDKQQPLRAWDAADEYLLQWLKVEGLKKEGLTNKEGQEKPDTQTLKTLVLNDSFGALSLSLHHLKLWSQSDSWLAQQGCRLNLELNDIENSAVTLLTSLQVPNAILDLVIIKIPKTLALLEDQLYRLRPQITAQTIIVAAGMTKQIHKSTLQLFENILGPTHSSLAQKKARLIFCQPSPQRWQGDSPYPTRYPLENSSHSLINHANVFSRASLDIGTRLLMEHLTHHEAVADIIDLGCGNGLLGLLAAEKNPQAHVHFYDESHMAVASARENWRANLGDDERAHFHTGNALAEASNNSADLILNNPPFHQQNVVGDHIAWQMFCDAHRVLRRNGELWVIGNRHLGYHTKLKRRFGNCQTLATNKKFVLLQTIKQ